MSGFSDLHSLASISPHSPSFLYFFHVAPHFISSYSIEDHMVASLRYVYRFRQMEKLFEVCRHILGMGATLRGMVGMVVDSFVDFMRVWVGLEEGERGEGCSV